MRDEKSNKENRHVVIKSKELAGNRGFPIQSKVHESKNIIQ